MKVFFNLLSIMFGIFYRRGLTEIKEFVLVNNSENHSINNIGV